MTMITRAYLTIMQILNNITDNVILVKYARELIVEVQPS